MVSVKNRTEHDLQNKLKWFILHIFKLFRKSLKTVKRSNLGTKFLKVRALLPDLCASTQTRLNSLDRLTQAMACCSPHVQKRTRVMKCQFLCERLYPLESQPLVLPLKTLTSIKKLWETWGMTYELLLEKKIFSMEILHSLLYRNWSVNFYRITPFHFGKARLFPLHVLAQM